MKVIAANNITSVTADATDANYPVTNLTGDQSKNYVKEKWKGTSNEGTLTINISSGDSIAIFGTNAVSVSIKVFSSISTYWGTDGNGETPSWGTDGNGDTPQWYVDSEGGEGVTYLYDLDPLGIGALWATYEYQSYGHTAEITLTAADGEIIEVGVIVAGKHYEFDDPKMGLKEGLHDYNVKIELNSGSWYIGSDRDVVRTFNFELELNRESEFYVFMHTIVRVNGSNPLAWFIASGLGNWEWVVFARFDKMPSGNHRYPEHTIVSVSIIEVV